MKLQEHKYLWGAILQDPSIFQKMLFEGIRKELYHCKNC